MLPRVTILTTLLVLAGLGAFVACARLGWLTPDEAQMRARYALPNSRFIELDGQPIHYVDEGSGEAIVLVHGSFGSLRMWESWARALRGRYRVIRFDRPPMGLSGPDPAGRYGADEEIRIIGRLTERLGIARFFLVATSSAGASGAGFAAAHPERVRGLVLSNIAVGPMQMDTSQRSARFRLVLMLDPLFHGWHPRELWRDVLVSNFADPSKVTPELVAEWTDLNNRAQRMPRAAGPGATAADFARTPADLAKITSPTLLLWSAEDREVPYATTARRGLALLAAQDKSLEVIAHCGHMMPIECGAESVAVAGRFIDRIAAASQ